MDTTGGHCPEGALLIRRQGGRAGAPGLSPVSSLDLAPSVLRHFAVALPAHLEGRPTIVAGQPAQPPVPLCDQVPLDIRRLDQLGPAVVQLRLDGVRPLRVPPPPQRGE